MFPQHIGFIMDGNRRWARAQGLPTLEGHQRGYAKMKKVGDWCLARGITIITVFAFSTENWKRSEKEVNYLMVLLERGLTKELKEFDQRGIRLKIIGRRQGLPTRLIKAITRAETHTEKNQRGLLQVAINYGGRGELIDAIHTLIKEGIAPERVDEATISAQLYTAGIPDPDLIIRTSGEQRLSGFLLWQSVYSELYFTATHWPAFSEHDLDEALAWYTSRQRRFGT